MKETKPTKAGELVTEVFDTVRNATYGKVCLVSGHSTLKRAADANVSPGQMRAIFEDLYNRSDEQIRGFIEIGQGLVDGSIKIPSRVFSEPEWRDADKPTTDN